MLRFIQLTLLAMCMAIPAFATKKADLKTQAWALLRMGVKDENAQHRATAIRVLSLLQGEDEAIHMACDALADGKPEVRTAAAMALGQLHANAAIPELTNALEDKEIPVVLAAAHSLILLKDKSAYDVYYAILTGERKGKGLVAGQMDTLKDPKKIATMGFEEGIGFIPFAGMGFTAVKTIMKDDSSPVRAAAAKVLADDSDPDVAQRLAEIAVGDKSELVRAAALESLARRDDSKMIEKIAPALSDEKDTVSYTAAAAIIRLSNLAMKPRKKTSAPRQPSLPRADQAIHRGDARAGKEQSNIGSH
jgi:HEAT repeat protein